MTLQAPLKASRVYIGDGILGMSSRGKGVNTQLNLYHYQRPYNELPSAILSLRSYSSSRAYIRIYDRFGSILSEAPSTGEDATSTNEVPAAGS